MTSLLEHKDGLNRSIQGKRREDIWQLQCQSVKGCLVIRRTVQL